MERIIALGAPSAPGLEELYKSGQLSRVEVESRTIAERKKRAEKVRSRRTLFYFVFRALIWVRCGGRRSYEGCSYYMMVDVALRMCT